MTPQIALISLALLLPSLTGVALGQGMTGSAFLTALNFQPRAHDILQRVMLISLAIIETGGILSLVMWGMLLNQDTSTAFSLYGYLGIALAMGVPGFLTSFQSYKPIKEAFMAIARQPHLGQSALNLLLLLLSFIQTPLIFGTIISWFIFAQPAPTYISDAIRLLAAGGTIGLGAVGPIIGLTTFASQAFHTIGRYKDRYNDVVSFTFMSQAIIETPILFALVISLFLVFVINASPNASHAGIPYILAMACIAGTTFGAGMSSSRTATATCRSIGRYAQSYRPLVRTSVLAQTLIDTTVIYGLIIAFFFLFV